MKSSLFSRYTCFVLSILLTLVFLIMMHNHPWFWLPALACGCLMVLGICGRRCSVGSLSRRARPDRHTGWPSDRPVFHCHKIVIPLLYSPFVTI